MRPRLADAGRHAQLARPVAKRVNPIKAVKVGKLARVVRSEPGAKAKTSPAMTIRAKVKGAAAAATATVTARAVGALVAVKVAAESWAPWTR